MAPLAWMRSRTAVASAPVTTTSILVMRVRSARLEVLSQGSGVRAGRQGRQPGRRSGARVAGVARAVRLIHRCRTVAQHWVAGDDVTRSAPAAPG